MASKHIYIQGVISIFANIKGKPPLGFYDNWESVIYPACYAEIARR